MNPRTSAGQSNLYNHYYYYETTRPPETSTYARPGTRTARQRPQEAARSYENDALCVVTAPEPYTTKTSAGNQVYSPTDELHQQYVALSERVDELHELRRREGYGARMDEINAVRVEMARVAGKLNGYPSSLPEYPPNKGRVQTLDALCVEKVLTHSYLQESRDWSKRHAHSSYMPPRTPGRRITTSSTPLLAVDASNCVHNTVDGFHRPTCQDLACIDEGGFDYVETTKDTSPRRVPTFLPSVDASDCVHNTFDGSQQPTRRKSRCLDEIGVDCDENTKATSVRRVPIVPDRPSTFQPVVDASNRVYNSSNTSHNPMRRKSSCFDGTNVDYIEDTEDTSVIRVPPSNHPVHTAGRRTMTSTAHLPTVDVSKHVHNLPNTSYNLTCRKSTRFDDDCIDYQGDVKDTSYGRVPLFLPTMNVSKHVHNVSGDSYNPTRRHSTRLDAYCVDLIESTEDLSYGRASTILPTTDASKRVYRSPTSLYGPKDQCTSRTTRFDISSNTDHQENDKDTSSRRVPSSFLPPAAGRRITTSATLLLAVDVSRHVHHQHANV
jgi:hypothetical protein